MPSRVALLSVVLILLSCRPSPPQQQSPAAPPVPSVYSPTGATAQDDNSGLRPSTGPNISFSKTEVRYAEGFRLTYHEDYKLLEILQPFQDKADTLRYSLVPKQKADQISVPNTHEISIPVRDLIVTSATHVALTDMLNANGRISGVVGGDYIYNPVIRRRIKKGAVRSFPNGTLNWEVALAMDPDLIMISGGRSSQFDNYRILRESEIPVLVNAEWLETTPLGKAEWVKVMAALLNKEQLANRQFQEVEQRYHKLKQKVQDRSERPLVINNMSYKGAWFVSGGNSYTARYLKDAGAQYPWFHTADTGGLRRSFEEVYEVGLRADIWIQPGTADTKKEILMKDERFRDFKAFKTGRIYNNDKRENAAGGNDFWETGVVRPDLVLADLIKIFHPDALPNHSLYFYREVL